jgi:hypothetical protein
VLFAAGAVTGALALTRENALVFAAIIGAWILWRERATRLGIFVAGLALVLLPVALRNLAVGGELTLTTSQSGPNFYMGNHEGATGHYVPLKPGREMPEFERVDATDLAQQATGRTLTPREVSAYWWKSSLKWMGEHPGDWAVLLGRKVLLTWKPDRAAGHGELSRSTRSHRSCFACWERSWDSAWWHRSGSRGSSWR